MSNRLKAYIQLRRATAQEWLTANPVLKAGEPGIETDELKIKIGNGESAWSDLPYISNSENIAPLKENILLVDNLPEEGVEDSFYKVNSTQKLYYWNNLSKDFVCLNIETQEFVDTNTDNILIVDSLPQIGQENLLYKLPDQSFYYWDSISNSFAPLVAEVEIPEIPEIEVKGGIETVDFFNQLPENGESDVLYKVLSTELIYSWNAISSSYETINEMPKVKTSLVVVETFI